MNYAQVCEAFSLLAGITMAEVQKYEQLINLAIDEVRKRLRVGISEEGNAQMLTLLAAAQAYYSYALVVFSQERATTIQAGEVKIAGNPNLLAEGARAVRNEIFAAASEIIDDDSFVFSGVGNA